MGEVVIPEPHIGSERITNALVIPTAINLAIRCVRVKSINVVTTR